MSSRRFLRWLPLLPPLVACASARAPLPAAPPPKSPIELAAWASPPPLAPEPPPALDLAAHRIELDSGLHVTVVSRPGSPATSIRLWLPRAWEVGHGPVAAMGEVLRAGTRTRSGETLVNPRLSGAAIRVLTGPKGTEFQWQVLPRASKLGLTLLADFVLHPAFDPAEVQIRLQQELGAIQRYSGTYWHQADIARGALPGFDHPNPESDARRLIQLDVAELRRVHACTVRPEGAELVIVGPVEVEAAAAWAREAFGAWPAAARENDASCAPFHPAPSPAREPPDVIQARIIYGGGTEDPFVVLVVLGPGPESPDYAAFTLLARALDDRDVGPARQLRHSGATYGLHAWINRSFPDTTLLEVQGQLEPERVQNALRDVIADIRGLSTTLAAADLESVRRRWLAEYVQALSSNELLIQNLMEQLQRGNAVDSLERWAHAIGAVQLADCQRAAKRWLDDAQPAFAVSGLPTRIVRGFGLDMRLEEFYWTTDPQEYKKVSQ